MEIIEQARHERDINPLAPWAKNPLNKTRPLNIETESWFEAHYQPNQIFLTLHFKIRTSNNGQGGQMQQATLTSTNKTLVTTYEVED